MEGAGRLTKRRHERQGLCCRHGMAFAGGERAENIMSETLEAPAGPVVDFDPDALRERYRRERDRRLRVDANDQYVEVKGDFRHYVDDPYVEPGFTRAPVVEELEALVIGGGFGGMMAAARLREAGVKDL